MFCQIPWIILTLAGLSATNVDAAPGQGDSAPAAAILPIDQVRAGMKGYGLTVFEGTRIEPFAVEVITVERDFGPKRGLIWVKCPEPRMRFMGPVQGMSGSPIYLWTDDEPYLLGHGGRLIGAFAWSFPGSKVCYAGIQPIELMREVAGRVNLSSGQGRDRISKPNGVSARATFASILELGAGDGLAKYQTWRCEALARLFDEPNHDDTPNTPTRPIRLDNGFEGTAQRMMLPVSVSNVQLARALSHLLQPLGMNPVVSTTGANSGNPPAWIDPDAIKLEPGSMVGVPLVFGDRDLSALGTVTERLPDGTILAFGHSMAAMGLGFGDAALPMSTAYVHFILPHDRGSFKFGGSVQVKGTVVRDEESAIAGLPEVGYATAPVDVVIDVPHEEQRTYHYEVVEHRLLTPVFAALVAAQSIVAVHGTPMDHTVHLSADMKFEGNRELKLESMIPLASSFGVLSELVGPMSALANNPFEHVMLDSLTMHARVENKILLGSIMHGRLDRAQVAPGDTIGVMVRLQKRGGEFIEKRVDFKIPHSVPEGKYELIVCDAATYVRKWFVNRPHMLAITNVDQLFGMIELITNVPSDAFFVIMTLPEMGLAVGQHELPKLPSSRQALMAMDSSTLASPYRDWIVHEEPVDMVTVGELKFKIVVTKSRSGGR